MNPCHSEQRETRAANNGTAGARARTRVLIVEDDFVVGMVIQLMLENQKCQVVGVVNDGLVAVESMSELQPDVVIMDLKMPVMDGFEATRRIMESLPVPIIVLSAYDTPDWRVKALEAGVAEYLAKPATEEDLAAAIERVRLKTC